MMNMGRKNIIHPKITWMDAVYGALSKPEWLTCPWTGNKVWKVTLLNNRSGQIYVSHEFSPDSFAYGFSVVHGLVHDWITTREDTSKWEPQCNADDNDTCPVCS